MAGSLTIAHISDIHLRKGGWTPHQYIPGVHRPSNQVVEALGAELSRQASAADQQRSEFVAVLSGDLSLLGKSVDVDHARCWWAGVLAGRNSIYVLGNHDYWGGSVPLSVLSSPLVQWRVRRDHWPDEPSLLIDLDGLRVRLYVIDTTPWDLVRNTATLGLLSSGRCGQLEDAIRRDRAQDKAEGRDSLRIVVMHHPMLARFVRASLADVRHHREPGQTLRSIVRPIARHHRFFVDVGVGLVLAGHTHQWALHPFGVIQGISPSSTLPKPPYHPPRPPAYWIHRLSPSGAGNVSVVSTRLAYSDHGFTPEETLPSYTIFSEPPTHRA